MSTKTYYLRKRKKLDLETPQQKKRKIIESFDETFETSETSETSETNETNTFETNFLSKLLTNTKPKSVWEELRSENLSNDFANDLLQLRETSEKLAPNLEKILTSNLPTCVLAKCYRLYTIYSSIEPSLEKIAIGKEIEEHLSGTDPSVEKNQMIEKIESLSTSFSNKSIIQMFAHRIYTSDLLSTETQSLKDKLMWYVRLPYNFSKEMRLFQNSSAATLRQYSMCLNESLYGLDSVKSSILEILCARLENISKTNILGIVGPPGVGKTSIADILGNLTGLGVYKISLGGLEDTSIFTGTNSSWVGANPGQILYGLRSLQCNNGIILLDEFDKIANEKLQMCLLSILDPKHNSFCSDVYLSEITHDFSNLWFILTMNSISSLDPHLLDRMDVLTIPNYTLSERKVILKDYLLPKVLKSFRFSSDEIQISDETIEFVCKSCISCREISKVLNKIISRIHLEKTCEGLSRVWSIPNLNFPYLISKEVFSKIYPEFETKEICLSMYI